jgi:hypothetical protein
MTNLLFALLAWGQPTEPETITGMATYYADGVMEQVIANRGLPWGDGVALNAAGDLGRFVWVQFEDGSIIGPLPVVDCAQEQHYDERRQQGRVVEVSAQVARQHGFYGVGPVPVTVWFGLPPVRWN